MCTCYCFRPMPLLDDGHHMGHHFAAHPQHPHPGAGFHNMNMGLNHFNMGGHYMGHHDKYAFHCPPKMDDPQTLNLVKSETLCPPYFYPTMDALPVTANI